MSDKCPLPEANYASPPDVKYCPFCGAEAEVEPGLNKCTESDSAFWVDW